MSGADDRTTEDPIELGSSFESSDPALDPTETPPPVFETAMERSAPRHPTSLPTALTEEASLEGTVIADRYLVHRAIGRGGMGAVYEAEHVHMKKRVAIKILHREMAVSAEVVTRFEREAIAAARIQHPSVVTATDFGQLGDGRFYLVLEFVDGKSLSELLREEGALAPERAFQILIQVNGALGAAHEAGIVHRDLKPDNVMVIETGDGEDFVKVLDFGIAKLHDEEAKEGRGITRIGVVFGTPEYMSPEQAKGEAVDARTDLYALGMIGYEMLAGESAFRGPDLLAVLTAQITETPAELPDSVPGAFRELVSKLLEKEPDRRFQTAQECGEALRALAEIIDYPLPYPRTSAGTRLDVVLAQSRRSTADGFAELRGGPKVIESTGFERLRSLSMRPVSIGPRAIPLWVPVLALAVGLGFGILSMWRYRDVFFPGPAAPPGAPPAQTADDPLLALAQDGDREALAELRKLVEKSRQNGGKRASGEDAARDVARLMALGRGYAVLRHHSAAMEAYERAVELDPHSAEDPDLLAEVRAALEERDAFESGLYFARDRLGSLGADMIYDVYRDHLGKPGMTAIVARAQRLVRDPALRANASPALAVALDLERAEACAEYREVLPRAVSHGDERSLYKLEALRAKKGCGPGAARDCFPCLRSPDVPLEEAIEKSTNRKAPALLGPRSAE